MAGNKKPKSVQRRERRRHTQLVRHKMQMIAAGMPLEDMPEMDPGEAMQLIINRTTMLWRAAAAEVDRLKPGLNKNQSEDDTELWGSWDENGNFVVNANYWVVAESRLREELGRLTEQAQKLGLAERRTRVQEGQMQLLGQALQTAAKLAGLTVDQQRLLGQHLRSELEIIEGTATEPPAALPQRSQAA